MSEDNKRRRGDPEPTLIDHTKAKQGKSVYHCNYCCKDLSDVVRIKCATCPDFDLCLECFSVGAEVTPHKNDHPYKIMERLDFPLITDDWTANEELLLLEGIEICGLGNWADVAMHVMTKNKMKCESHYYHCYIARPQCLPDLSHAISKTQFIPRSVEEMTELQKPYMGSQDALPYPGTGKKSTEKQANASRANNNFYANCPPGSDIVGYMPGRGDFDIEWDNDAEGVLCEMAFKSDDLPIEVDLKNKVLESYNWKLDERSRRKKFVLERGLLDLKKQQALDRRRAKDERDIYQQMRVFARFQTAEEHEEFIRSIIMEKKIRKRIEQLQFYRQMGIHTLHEGDNFETNKKKKELEKQKIGGKDASPFIFGPERKGRKPKDEPDDYGFTPKRPRTAPESAVSYLSAKEQELCNSLRITPLVYLAAKECIVREFLRGGGVGRATIRRLVKVTDAARTDRIFDFVVASGWINPERDPRVVFAGQPNPAIPMNGVVVDNSINNNNNIVVANDAASNNFNGQQQQQPPQQQAYYAQQ